MRYFLDTEFIDTGTEVDLVSIGLVCEDGREYYAISTEFDAARASEWVVKHVLAQLPPRTAPVWKARAAIRDEIVAFVGLKRPEFWAYCGAYDWVLLCQLFGGMVNLPGRWPGFAMDLKQWAVLLGNVRLPKQETGEHDALEDARWNRRVWEKLAAVASGGART